MLVRLLMIKCFTLTVVVSMRGPHHPRGGHHHHSPKPNQKITQDTQLLQDVEHIKEDLGNILTDEQAHKMTPEELEFHYFKLHDFDNNTKLDGLEILQAIHHSTHGSDEENEYHEGNDVTENKQKAQLKMGTNHGAPQVDGTREGIGVTTSEDFQYFVDLIDQVLAEDDLDNDGYLSYIEYVVGRQKDQSKRSSNTHQNH